MTGKKVCQDLRLEVEEEQMEGCDYSQASTLPEGVAAAAEQMKVVLAPLCWVLEVRIQTAFFQRWAGVEVCLAQKAAIVLADYR